MSSPLNQPSGVSASELFATDELESLMSAAVGPRPADRAPHETRIVNDFVGRSGGIIDNESDVGGYPDYATQTRSLSPPSSDVLDWLRQYTAEVEGTTD